MRISPVIQPLSFKNNKYIFDAKNKNYALREFAEHPDLVEIGDKSKKVIDELMNRTCLNVSLSSLDTIATLEYIRDKYPHLKKISEECIELIRYYNEYKIW